MEAQPPHEITRLLGQVTKADGQALADLMPLVYSELRRIAGHYMRQERADHTLQSTALVHEAYLRLAGPGAAKFENRAHFFTAAAQLMRWILLDHARKRGAGKRGGESHKVELEDIPMPSAERSAELLAIDEALTALERIDAQQARIVELRYFIGMSIEETADVLGISPATVKREWSAAKAFLKHAVRQGPVPE
jgi:RNA polymerase sigma-70 factor, ECF subfamily